MEDTKFMKYGQRLKSARDYAGLSQAGLAEKAKVGTQENISKLERSNADGSEFTVQYAVACKINPVWLATGEGEMTDVMPYTADPWVTRVVRAMQHMKEEDERYVVITSEALVKHKARPYDGPQRRKKNESPNAERRWGEINYEGSTDWQYDSTDEAERKRGEKQ